MNAMTAAKDPSWIAEFWPYLLLGAIAIQRIVELAWSEANRRRLLRVGAREMGRSHYPIFIALHSLWLITMLLFVEPGTRFNLPVFVALLLLQLLRLWTIASLGPFWTTRIMTLDSQPLRRKGPYRFIRHPNYLIVAFEIPLVPLLIGMPVVALTFGIANVFLLAWRIRVEDEVLRPRREIHGTA